MIPAGKGEEEEDEGDEERMERKDLPVIAPWQFEFPGMLSSRWDLGILELSVPRAQTGNDLSSIFIQTFSLHAFRIPFFFPPGHSYQFLLSFFSCCNLHYQGSLLHGVLVPKAASFALPRA